MSVINLNVGENIAQIRAEEKLIKRVRYEWREFITKNPADFEINIELVGNISVAKYFLRDNTGKLKELDFYTKKIISTEKKVTILGDIYSGEILIDEKKASFQIYHQGVALWIIFRTIILEAFAFILISKGCLLMHASGVSFKDKGYLFMGQSGTGKSTIAKLTNEKILNDETVMIKCQNNIEICGTPFGGDYSPTNNCVLLKKIFIPKQSNRIHFEKIKPIIAQPIVMNCESISMNVEIQQNKEITNKIFNLFVYITKKIECFKMDFEKNNKFWKKIQDGKI